MHSALSAARTAVVRLGSGPSSNVSTTSFGLRKSYDLVVLEAEAGAAGGVDLDDARDAERIGIAGALGGFGGGRSGAHRLLFLCDRPWR